MFQLIKRKKVTLIRRGHGQYDEFGIWQEGVENPVEIDAHIQPFKYHELIRLPESERSKKWCKIYTTRDVQLNSLDENESKGSDADRFYWQEDLYEIQKKQDWDVETVFTTHNCAIAVRVEQTPDQVESLY